MEYYQTSSRSRSNVLALALAAAEAGRAVFPLNGKVPAIGKRDGGNGYKDASRDRSRVHALFNRAGRDVTGYGVACGASALAVLDWDGPEGLAELKRRGMPPTLIVKTARGGHAYYRTPPGVEIKSRDVAPGLELKASGAYVVGTGSMHPSGTTYTVARDRPISDAPAWILKPCKPEREATPRAEHSPGPLSIDLAGEPIPDGERNRTLARICGRLHDGTRDLAQLTRDLLAVNEARCTPPLEAGEVRKIAESIHRLEPCNPRPQVSERVLSKIDYLRRLAEDRPVRGMAGASGWAIYHAGLDLAREYGRDHADGFTLSVDRRTWAQGAATNNATVTRWLRRCPLVEVIDQGSGRRSSTVLFRVPEGCYSHHSSTYGDRLENGLGRSDATNTLFRNLYRSRWSERSRKAGQGVVPGTRRVRDSVTPGREGLARMGKSRAVLLDLIRRNPDAARADLARLKGVKPASLTHPLRWLLDAGLIVRTSRGRYAAAGELAQRVQDARSLAEEPEADRDQMLRHELERARHRHRQTGEGHETPPASEAAYQRSRERREREMAERVGRVEDLQRVPDPDPELMTMLRDALRRYPDHRNDYPSWWASTLWADGYVKRRPDPVAVEVALYELRREVAA